MLKQILRKLVLGEKASSDDFIRYLRSKGVTIGEHCKFYDPHSTVVDVQNPWMISIGDYVKITAGVKILTHDYSISVLTGVCGDVLGSVDEVIIGNKVFIGMNTIILKGAHIGDNVIIGAGSVVSGDCESNSVYAGVPAVKICTLQEMYKRNKEKELEKAKRVALSFYRRTGKIPDANVLREYQLIFTKRDEGIPDSLEKIMRNSGNDALCKQYFTESNPQFDGIDRFLEWCGINVQNQD